MCGSSEPSAIEIRTSGPLVPAMPAFIAFRTPRPRSLRRPRSDGISAPRRLTTGTVVSPSKTGRPLFATGVGGAGVRPGSVGSIASSAQRRKRAPGEPRSNRRSGGDPEARSGRTPRNRGPARDRLSLWRPRIGVSRRRHLLRPVGLPDHLDPPRGVAASRNRGLPPLLGPSGAEDPAGVLADAHGGGADDLSGPD